VGIDGWNRERTEPGKARCRYRSIRKRGRVQLAQLAGNIGSAKSKPSGEWKLQESEGDCQALGRYGYGILHTREVGRTSGNPSAAGESCAVHMGTDVWPTEIFGSRNKAFLEESPGAQSIGRPGQRRTLIKRRMRLFDGNNRWRSQEAAKGRTAAFGSSAMEICTDVKAALDTLLRYSEAL
jgi:hypothetical protein